MLKAESHVDFDGESVAPVNSEKKENSDNTKNSNIKNEDKDVDLSDLEIQIEGSHILKLPKEKISEQHKETVEDEKFTEIEKEALSKGWSPKDKFKGDPSLWRSAEYYLGKMEMSDKVSERNKRIKRLEMSLEKMTEYFQKNIETTQNQEREKLIEKRNEAIDNRDVNKVNEIDKKLVELNQSKVQLSSPNTPVAPTQEVIDFVEENKHWFNSETSINRAMSSFAIEEDTKMARDMPSLSAPERLEKVKRLVQEEFPKYFKNEKNENENKSSETETFSRKTENNSTPYKGESKMVAQPFETVSKSKNQPRDQKKISWNSLPPHVKQVIHEMYRVTKNPKMTKEEYAQFYVNDLIKSGNKNLLGLDD